MNQQRSKITTMPKVLLILLLSLLSANTALANKYDLVIAQGRVIDPETKLDKVQSIGIQDGEIVEISSKPLAGKKVINARGLVVAPGFIDVHTHTPTILGQHMAVLDGVTTQLDLEAGAFPVSAYGEHFAGGAQVNYGASVAHFSIRTKVLEDIDQPYIFGNGKTAKFATKAFSHKATKKQINAMRALLHKGLDEGGLGIGVLLDYMTSAVSDEELAMIFEVAGERKAPIFVHVRRGMKGDPAGLDEVIALTKKTSAPLFICHITHLAMGQIDTWLAKIDQANAAGANISTETLSYAAGGTSISADVFVNRDWRAIFDIDYEDVQWVATGEWLTEETWNKYMKEQPRGMINHHYVKEEWIETALKWPGMMVSTDALPAFDRDVFTNPNVSGTFSRLLGHYVRDRGVLDLSQGLATLSLNQAKWMAQASPLFNKKGRIQVGMDADIVVFDPHRIRANATYGKPYLKSTGITHVIVGGRQVVSDGEQIEGRYPGRRILNVRTQ